MCVRQQKWSLGRGDGCKGQTWRTENNRVCERVWGTGVVISKMETKGTVAKARPKTKVHVRAQSMLQGLWTFGCMAWTDGQFESQKIKWTQTREPCAIFIRKRKKKRSSPSLSSLTKMWSSGVDECARAVDLWKEGG